MRRQGTGLLGPEAVDRCRFCFNFGDVAAIAAESHEQDISIDTRDMMVNVSRRIVQLQNAASSSCTICAIVLEILVFFHFDIEDDENAMIILKIPIETGSPEIAFRQHGIEQTAQIYTSDVPRSYPWKTIPTLPELAKDRLTPESLKFIRECLQNCSMNHEQCQKQRGPTQVQRPRRLLRVGDKYDTNVRLVEAEDMISIHSPYAALSYCWGGAVTYAATSKTQHFLRHGIDLLQLPKVFIDAISLARHLGIPYIWIDALCIIQDSVEDWDTESAKMASIYSNAYLTIAASSSHSASQAFLGHRHPPRTIDRYKAIQTKAHEPSLKLGPSFQETHRKRLIRRFELPEETPSTQPEPSDDETQQLEGHDDRVFSVDIEPPRFNFEPIMLKARLIAKTGVHWRWNDDHEDRIPKDALSRRAWTLQEQLLSARLLSISAFEMQWTCRESSLCECRSRVNTGRQLGRKPIVPEGTALEIFRFWHKVIENYSIRGLSYSKDKLPAISGVAQIVQEKVKSRYLAGLWEHNIDRDLLWRRTGPIGNGTLNDVSAPTFSWASADGEVDYYCFRDKHDTYIKSTSVLAIDTIPRRQAPLGSVFEGSLKLQGPLLSAVLELPSKGGWALVTVGHMAIVFAVDARVQQMIFDDSDGNPKRTVCRWRYRRPVNDPCNNTEETPAADADADADTLPATNNDPSDSSGQARSDGQQAAVETNQADPGQSAQAVVTTTDTGQTTGIAPAQSTTSEAVVSDHSVLNTVTTTQSDNQATGSNTEPQPAELQQQQQQQQQADQINASPSTGAVPSDGHSKRETRRRKGRYSKRRAAVDGKSDEEEDTSSSSPPSEKSIPLEIQCWVMKMGSFIPNNDGGLSGHPQAHCDQELMILGRSSLQPQLYERIGLATSRAGLVQRAFDNAPSVSVVVV